jgi:hypothetical protein
VPVKIDDFSPTDLSLVSVALKIPKVETPAVTTKPPVLTTTPLLAVTIPIESTLVTSS